ncbi:MAG: replication protein [Armatimonadetes bacterium]|nr:replication protein [Armatimonadota bacterium]
MSKQGHQRDPFANFDGYEVPRYTQVPDQLFDEHLPYLGHAELKVLLYIIRRTFGWGKEADAISLAQLERGTGLSRRAVREAVKSLEEKRLILPERYSTPRGDPGVNIYRLNIKRASFRSPPATARLGAKVAGEEVPYGRGGSTLPQGTNSPTVGEPVPHLFLESSDYAESRETLPQKTLYSETSTSLPLQEQLATLFFEVLGQNRVARKKRERAVQIISELLTEGFSQEEIRAAIHLAAERQARDAGILPYVIGEALASSTTPSRETPPPPQPSPESTYEDLVTELLSLPASVQAQLREAAIARLGKRCANEAVIQGVMIGLYKKKGTPAPHL